MKNRIYYTKPSITEKEIAYAADAAQNGWGELCNKYVNQFESIFSEYLGVNYGLATSSCTGALHMGLAALGIRQGDEVILADTNWIATVAPIVYLGAKPVFVDILEDTWCINPEALQLAITPKTKAIIATHLYGNLSEMDDLLAIGAKYDIPIIEDSAEAIGSVYRGKKAGSIGKFGVFSFHGSKTITSGEGGIFVTNDSQLYETVLTLSNHGRSRTQNKQFWPDVVGYKYKMSNLQAAIGCAQMERVKELVARKQEILSYYREALLDFPGVSMNPERSDLINGAWMPTIVFGAESNVTREVLQAAFASENIDARVFFHPLSSLPMFNSKQENKVAWALPARAINLPSYHDISEDELARVVSVIKNVAL